MRQDAKSARPPRVAVETVVQEEKKTGQGLKAALAAVIATAVGAAAAVVTSLSPAPQTSVSVNAPPIAQQAPVVNPQLGEMTVLKTSGETVVQTSGLNQVQVNPQIIEKSVSLTQPELKPSVPEKVESPPQPPEEPVQEPAPPSQDIVRMFYPVAYVSPLVGYWDLDTALYCFAHHYQPSANQLRGPPDLQNPSFYDFETGEFRLLTKEDTFENNVIWRENNFAYQPFYPSDVGGLDLEMREVARLLNWTLSQREDFYWNLARNKLLNYAWYSQQRASSRLRPQFPEELKFVYIDGVDSPDTATQYFFNRYPMRTQSDFANNLEGLIAQGDIAILGYPSFSGSLVLQVTFPSFVGAEASILKGNLSTSSVMGGNFRGWPGQSAYAHTQTIENSPKNILINNKVQASVLPIGFGRVDDVILKLTFTDSRDGKKATYEIHFLII